MIKKANEINRELLFRNPPNFRPHVQKSLLEITILAASWMLTRKHNVMLRWTRSRHDQEPRVLAIIRSWLSILSLGTRVVKFRIKNQR